MPYSAYGKRHFKKSYSVLCQDFVNRCEYIKSRSKDYPINVLCRVCNVSRSGYYDWLTREDSSSTKKNRLLLAHIKSIFYKSRCTYGAIRLTKELKFKGFEVNKKRVSRLMRENGLKSVYRRKFKVCTTTWNHELPISPNILKQDFSTTMPNQKWGCDITYISRQEGFLYLSVILDFFSRKIVGWSLDDTLESQLCVSSLNMALSRRKSPQTLIHHSDRGSQYSSTEYRSILESNNIIPSMSRTGNCYDNAMTESFFHTLKVECVYQNAFSTKFQAQGTIFNYIENFYNNWRRYSSIDYLSPVSYETKFRLARNSG